MHQTLYENLRIKSFLLQFHVFLTRGFFSEEERSANDILLRQNLQRLELMKSFNWDANYDLVRAQIKETEEVISLAKKYLNFEQICSDIDIADYLIENNDHFHSYGIRLIDLKNLFAIDKLFHNGYMLHDVFNGYPEKNMYRFLIDCTDYIHTSAHFYNEGYDYLNEIKEVELGRAIKIQKPFEMKRIQLKDEVIMRNFRESYINIIFFIESFINSVAYDAFLAGFAKNENDELKLKGIQRVNQNNGRKNYSNLSNKIKDTSRIISGVEIKIDQEPFISYLDNDVSLRNQYVHSSVEKGKEYLSPLDWKEKCDKMISNDCFEILNTFWKSCYPNKHFPKVIYNTFWHNSFKGHQGSSFALD